MSDERELDLQRRANTTTGLDLWNAEAEPTDRLRAALASAEGSGTATEDRLVAEIQAMLRTRYRWSVDDIAELLDAAGVAKDGPGALGIRRRYASRIVNAGVGKWWTKCGEMMTARTNRSGRKVAIWQTIQFPEAK